MSVSDSKTPNVEVVYFEPFWVKSSIVGQQIKNHWLRETYCTYISIKSLENIGISLDILKQGFSEKVSP